MSNKVEYGKKCQSIVERYKAGDTEAINELPPYMDNLIHSLLKPYKNYNDIDDMYQVAWQAVMRSIESYDVSYGTLFTTFAYVSIKRDLRHYRNKVDKHKSNYTEEGECTFKIMSLDGTTKVDNRIVNITDYIVSPENVEDYVFFHELIDDIHTVLESYTNTKHKSIIEDFLHGEPQVDIAKQYEVSPTCVCRVIKKFYEKCAEYVNK